MSTHSDNLDFDKILSETGIEYLTGESCAYSMRILCDITPDAESILSEFLGGNIEFNQPAWNGYNGALHSIMLTRSMLFDLALFVALHKYALVVYYDCSKHGLQPMHRGYMSLDDYQTELNEHTWLQDSINRVWHGSTSGRNVHQFSGRME